MIGFFFTKSPTIAKPVGLLDAIGTTSSVGLGATSSVGLGVIGFSAGVVITVGVVVFSFTKLCPPPPPPCCSNCE